MEQNGQDSGQSGIVGADSTLRSSRQGERHVQWRTEFEVSCVGHQMLGGFLRAHGSRAFSSVRRRSSGVASIFFSWADVSDVPPHLEKARILPGRSLEWRT